MNTKKIYKLYPSENYPESYWFNCILPGETQDLDFVSGCRLEYSQPVIFTLRKKVSTRRILSYDFYQTGFCASLFVASPRLVALLSSYHDIFNDIQLIDSVVRINDKDYYGYKAINIIRRTSSLIDIERSDYYTTDCNTYFYNIVFKEDIKEDFNITIVIYDGICATVAISEKFRKFLEDNKVKGLNLSKNPPPVWIRT